MRHIFTRQPWTDWTIVIGERYNDSSNEETIHTRPEDFEEFSAFFRTGMRDDKECEMFTLVDRTGDFAFLWVNIFKDGKVEAVSHIPSVITTNPRKKTVEILPLVYCGHQEQNHVFNHKVIDSASSGHTVHIKY